MLYKIKKQEKQPGSVVEVSIEIESALLEKKWPAAVKHLNEHLTLDGFRKGHIPEKVLVQKVGEIEVLEEAAELAIQEVYSDIIKESGLNPLGQPKIVITKIAKGNPLELTMRISIIPEIKLPDYKAISKKVMGKEEKIEVEEKEVEDVIKEIQAHQKNLPAGQVGDDKNPEIEITDEFVKTMGDFKDVADFKAKIKENLGKEKEFKLKEKKRMEILEGIAEKASMDIPEILIENELQRMIQEFTHELSRMNMTFENYLVQIKKTEDDVKKDWTERASKRVVNELLLLEIAKAEKIEAKKEEIEKESKHLEEHYPDSPKERIYAFVEEMIIKEDTFKFLEAQK